MRLDDVRDRLSESAYGGDLGSDLAWELKAYEDFARITAATPDSYGTAVEAFAASEALCAALLGDDLHLRNQARLGARCENPEEASPSWVGVVEIGVADQAPEPDIF